ncbi:MAG TPA: hypothetical protein EYP85_11215 [Armatimonadetes bacterium]|nr:hypothetical protein [Armatimonadota bacterium]
MGESISRRDFLRGAMLAGLSAYGLAEVSSPGQGAETKTALAGRAREVLAHHTKAIEGERGQE